MVECSANIDVNIMLAEHATIVMTHVEQEDLLYFKRSCLGSMVGGFPLRWDGHGPSYLYNGNPYTCKDCIYIEMDPSFYSQSVLDVR